MNNSIKKNNDEFWNDTLESGYYDKIYNEGLLKKRGLRSFWHYFTFKKVSKYIDKDIDHLDFACGPGTLIGNYSKKGSIGVDVSEKQINFAQNKYKEYKFFSLSNFNFDKHINKFDLITVLGLFEFLSDEDIDKLLKNLEKTLKKGGKIIITTPNFSLSMELLIKFINVFGNVNYANLYFSKFNKDKVNNFKNKFDNFNISITKILNISVFFSFISYDLAERIDNFIEKFLNEKFGFLYLIILEKVNK